MNDFGALDAAIDAMIARMSPAGRKALAARLATDLRAANARRIAANEEPDGAAMTPRKAARRLRDRQPLRARAPSGKRQLAARRMFVKAGTSAYLRRQSGPDGAEVGFAGAMARIMRVHQLGERDTVTRDPGSPEVQYPVRQVLGFSGVDRAAVLNRVAEHLGGG